MLDDRLQRERKGELLPNHWLQFPLPISATIIRNEDGNLRGSGLLGLIGTFKDSRLRRCVICSRIFWAENKNSSTEAETCRNALRQRRHRQKNKEEVNAKRRENYRQNKKLKQLKEKKNGTL